MGFSSAQVVFTFLQVGLFISLPALLLGVILGCVFVVNLNSIKNSIEMALNAKIFDGAHYFLSYIPSSLNIGVVLQITVLGGFLCFISIIIPSLRAAKANPINALRWE
jgi:lipoprotein-releasing system permease protein